MRLLHGGRSRVTGITIVLLTFIAKIDTGESISLNFPQRTNKAISTRATDSGTSYSQITGIEGNLDIWHYCTTYNSDAETTACAAANGDGFEQLTTITGRLLFNYANRLQHIRMFPLLKSVGGILEIGTQQFDKLVSLDGLTNLDAVGGLRLHGLPAMASLNGLQNLRMCNGDFYISGLKALKDSHTLSALSTITGKLDVHNNYPGLLSLDFLPSSVTISGAISISGNRNLCQYKVENFCAVAGRTCSGSFFMNKVCNRPVGVAVSPSVTPTTYVGGLSLP